MGMGSLAGLQMADGMETGLGRGQARRWEIVDRYKARVGWRSQIAGQHRAPASGTEMAVGIVPAEAAPGARSRAAEVRIGQVKLARVGDSLDNRTAARARLVSQETVLADASAWEAPG